MPKFINLDITCLGVEQCSALLLPLTYQVQNKTLGEKHNFLRVKAGFCITFEYGSLDQEKKLKKDIELSSTLYFDLHDACELESICSC